MDQNEINDEIQIFRARWILPVSSPPIEDGVVVVQNQRILAVGPTPVIASQYSGTAVDLEDSVIFPGFINAHVHLERPVIPEEKRNNLKEHLYTISHLHNDIADSDNLSTIIRNIQQCFNSGTIALADYSVNGASVHPLIDSPIYGRVFFIVDGFLGYKAPHIYREKQKLIRSFEYSSKVTGHFAPFSVFSVSPHLFWMIVKNERHLSTHLAESEAEVEFLRSKAGPIRQFLLAKEDFDYKWKEPGMSPVRYFFSNHFYAKHNILVHMVHVSEEDMDFMKTTPVKSNICLCPRSDENLQVGKAPARLFLEKGFNLCLGTESLAEVPDLDMREELKKAVEIYNIQPDIMLKIATLNGAYATGFHLEVGSIEKGKSARCLYLHKGSANINDPYSILLESEDKPHWLI